MANWWYANGELVNMAYRKNAVIQGFFGHRFLYKTYKKRKSYSNSRATVDTGAAVFYFANKR